jgi:hypothetical protein
MVRAIQVEDRLVSSLNNRFSSMNQVLSRRALITRGPRTAILVRCEVSEADRIRESARRREMPINAFVLHALKRSWSVDTVHAAAGAAAEAAATGLPPTAGAAG